MVNEISLRSIPPPTNNVAQAPVKDVVVSQAASAVDVGKRATVKTQQQQDASPSEADIRKAAEQVQQHIQNLDHELHISMDNDAGRIVVKVVDPDTDEVIRQIPSEEIIKLARYLKGDGRGSLMSEQA